ncbi:MAG: TonB-dependent receptor [Cyclobacteriaceae bacterium]
MIAPLFGQEKPMVLGNIKDKSTNETLVGANIFWEGDINSGVVSDEKGDFAIQATNLPGSLVIKFIGYQESKRALNTNDIGKELKFFLLPEEMDLEEVVVSEQREDHHIVSLDIGKNTISAQSLKSIPALFGEVDLLRGLQLLPGVITAGEGTTGLFVRGGSADQNLIQIDGAPIFNPSHFFGFFSVFNPDALSGVELYKGNIPAQFGGRISSLVDISLKEGNTQKISGEGGIGSISSRLTVHGPMFSDRSSFFVSGRRTYADIFLVFAQDENIRNNQLYFYDLNGKLMWRDGNKNKFTLTTYFGSDFLGANEQFGLGWNNWVSSFNWNKSISDTFYWDFTAYHSYYKYLIAIEDEQNGFDWSNYFTESGIRGQVTWLPQEAMELRMGAHSQVYHFSPLLLDPVEGSEISPIKTNPKTGWQNNLFVSGVFNLSEQFSLEAGLRWSQYQQIGSGVDYIYENNDPAQSGAITDTLDYHFPQRMQNYQGLEPRAAFRYLLAPDLSLKGSYNRNFQYVQIVSNSSAGLPIDRWIPAGRYIPPIRGDQFSLGAFKNLDENKWEISVEGYYKDFDQIIDLKQGANILFSNNVETEILSGTGWAYGLEFLLRKNRGKTTGWLSYTWSRVFRKIEGINENQPYNPRFDRPHDFSLVLNHQVNERLSFSGTYIYTSGVAVTFPLGSYEVDNQRLPLYGLRRNEDRFPDYHRMDLSLNLKNKDKGRWWRGSWNFSIYNVYNRKNPFSYQFTDIINDQINFEPGPGDEARTVRPGVVMTYLFGILPSITYNFEF